MKIGFFNNIVMGLVILFSQQSFAITTIDINKGSREALPIAVVSFVGEDEDSQELGQEIARVIESDLSSSGLFRPIDKAAFIEQITPHTLAPNFIVWRQINATSLVTGKIKSSGDNVEIIFQLWDPYSEKSIAGKGYELNKKSWRRAAHKVSDQIYHRLTGDTGYFDTRIAYISESGPSLKRIKKLAIMDHDGENHKFLTDGQNRALTPRFSPDGQKILYLSFPRKGEKRPARVFIRDVHGTGKEKELGSFSGMSFAPRFNPAGDKVVMSVAEKGNTDIILMDLATGVRKKLTRDSGLDVSPCYSPDGSKIAFTSDRGGSPQLYVMDADGSNVNRISFGSGIYSTPVWSPRNDYIAFTKQVRGAGFYIGVMRPDGKGERILAQGFLVEGPAWSPNGRVIIFTRGERTYGEFSGMSKLYSIDVTGFNEREIVTPVDASYADWSPLLGD
jgi:TolB protein